MREAVYLPNFLSLEGTLLGKAASVGLAVVLAFCGTTVALAAHVQKLSGPVAELSKHRLIVLTDIEADPDDTELLVRLLLYADQIDIEGLIATTSTHQRNRVAPELIERVIGAFGKVRDNLERNEKDYPQAKTLLGLVMQGQPSYGMNAVGEGKDSPGSQWIVKALEKKDDRPLWVTVWGGVNTLAQALYTIEHSMSAEETKRLVAKLRVYTISDQDDSGIWIRTNFPGLFYIVSPGGYEGSTWGAMMQVVPGIDNTTISNKWLADHIQQGHGPLGAMYPDVAYGMEGDTPSFLSLIPNGLSAPEHPNWGGWGGRYELYTPDLSTLYVNGFTGGVPIQAEPRPIWTNASDDYTPVLHAEYGRALQSGTASFTGNRVTLWRWRDDFQNDFAARMDWTTKSYKEANHPPVPVLAHPDAFTVKSGESFTLSARGTTDPDGDSLSYLWFQYPEAGTYRGLIKFAAAENLYEVHVTAPVVEKPETAHFILRVTDKGTPPLSRYKRVIVTILPN